MIAGVAKAYCLPPEYVLHEMSYVNMIMYGAVIPSYNSKRKGKSKDGKEQEEVKVDDPRNRARVRQILDQFD